MAAPRSIGSLTISFGLVAIPVKLYTATQSTGQVSFNLLHKDCGSRLKQQYICLKDGQVVERDDIVKGYEFAKDQYVAFTPDEFKALEEVGWELARRPHLAGIPMRAVSRLLDPERGERW